MASKNMLLAHQNPSSRRFVTLHDDGTSAWLYLTEPDSRKPCGDAWVYNRIPAPPKCEIARYRGGPPPAAREYAATSALCKAPSSHEWSFAWSCDGEAVALLKDDAPVAFIIAGTKGGYSRELVKDGPWGHPWSSKLYKTTFEP